MEVKEALGIDIGGSGVKGAPVNIETGAMLDERFRIDTPKPATPQAVLETIHEIVKHFKWTGIIGCGYPGAVRNGVTLSAANVDDAWIGYDLPKKTL